MVESLFRKAIETSTFYSSVKKCVWYVPSLLSIGIAGLHSTSTPRGFHVKNDVETTVSTWNPRGVFVGQYTVSNATRNELLTNF